jgi:hypothetical protein
MEYPNTLIVLEHTPHMAVDAKPLQDLCFCVPKSVERQSLGQNSSAKTKNHVRETFAISIPWNSWFWESISGVFRIDLPTLEKVHADRSHKPNKISVRQSMKKTGNSWIMISRIVEKSPRLTVMNVWWLLWVEPGNPQFAHERLSRTSFSLWVYEHGWIQLLKG